MTEESTMTFTIPTAEFVEQALREVEWGDRLIGYMMTPTTGNKTRDMYSLPEAVQFLFGTKWDAPLLQAGYKGGINWVDVQQLVDWLRDVIGDVELADAVDRDVLGLGVYREQSMALLELFTERMNQYRAVRDAAAAAQAEAEPSE